MLSKLREPFGKAGLIVAIVALIAALGGGAYAASGGLSGKQKKEVTKIAQKEAKKYAGKQGLEGKQGPAGAKGDPGAPGANGVGTAGAAGTNGKSVEEIPIAAGPGETACQEQGGAEYLLEGAPEGTEICNGKEGSPWALGGLPKGATETGVWTFDASEASAEGGRVFVPISFSVQLQQKITGAANIHFVGSTGDATCTGTLTEPKAPQGMICIYTNEVVGANVVAVRELNAENNNEVDVAGAYLVFNGVENESYGRGSFAVTGG